jgi:hypothetical protein
VSQNSVSAMVLTASLQSYVAGISKAESQRNLIEFAQGSEVSFDVELAAFEYASSGHF